MADEPIKLTIQDTPDKLRPLAEEAAAFLAGVLRELAAAETRSFAQYTRLYKKGRVVEFRDGVREEITDTQMWKAKSQARFAALLDPYCTEKHIAQRRECLHSTHFPSSFNCIKTGCELVVTAKSAKKAESQLEGEEKPKKTAAKKTAAKKATTAKKTAAPKKTASKKKAAETEQEGAEQ